MKIFLVHRGFQFDKELQKMRPCNPLTYRLVKSDADEIAEVLNDKLHELRYLEFLATESNENLRGGRQAMFSRDTETNRKKISDLRVEAEKDERKASMVNFWVSEMLITGDEEEKLKAELAKEGVSVPTAAASTK